MSDLGIKAYNMPQEEWVRAQRVAKLFLKAYPERMGFRDCVVYSAEGCMALIVYRTKNFVVVRGTDK